MGAETEGGTRQDREVIEKFLEAIAPKMKDWGEYETALGRSKIQESILAGVISAYDLAESSLKDLAKSFEEMTEEAPNQVLSNHLARCVNLYFYLKQVHQELSEIDDSDRHTICTLEKTLGVRLPLRPGTFYNTVIKPHLPKI